MTTTDLALSSAGPLDLVAGLPTHVLVVHAVVVLLPLAAAGAVLVAVSPTWRERLRWPTVVLAAAGTAAAFVAAASGQELMDRFRLDGDPLVEQHADVGAFTRWWALLLLLALVGHLGLEQRSRTADRGEDGAAAGHQARTWSRVVAGLLVVVAVVTTVQTVLAGHGGSRAVWERQVEVSEQLAGA